jgi:hypothetical protein
MTDSSIITINSANSTVTDNNRFEYKLKTDMTLQDMEVGLVKGSVFHSMLNVKQSIYQNSTYQYVWPNGSGFTTYTITMPDGFYDIDVRFQGYLENQMTINKTYLIDSTGDPVFYLGLRTNSVYYTCTLTSTPVPSALPTGYTMPSGATWTLPLTNTTPQLVISTANINTGKLIGFVPGTYPSAVQSSTYQVNASTVPQINPQYAFNVCVNIVNLPYVNSIPDMIYPFNFTKTYMSQELLDPYQCRYYSATNGNYSEIIVTIKDQANKPALLQDPSSSFTIEIRKKNSGRGQ